MFIKTKTSIYIITLLVCLQLEAQEIIFSRSAGALDTGNTFDIMSYNPEQRTTRKLLKGTVRGRGEYAAQLSPDNSKIAFSTYRFSGWKLGIGDFKSGEISNVKRLTNRSNYEFNPSFSPDGTKVAYQEFNWTIRDVDIFITDVNNFKNTVHFVKSDGGDRSPVWTNDGKSLVFTSGRSGKYNIYQQLISESEAKILTDGNANYFAPSTSNTGSRVAFLSDKEGELDLYTMDLNTGKLKNLTADLKTDRFEMSGFESSGCWAYATSWSPDDRFIVFNLMIDGDLEVFVSKSDGSEVTKITNNVDSDITPFWTK